jgi:hypothetical protein
MNARIYFQNVLDGSRLQFVKCSNKQQCEICKLTEIIPLYMTVSDVLVTMRILHFVKFTPL